MAQTGKKDRFKRNGCGWCSSRVTLLAIARTREHLFSSLQIIEKCKNK